MSAEGAGHSTVEALAEERGCHCGRWLTDPEAMRVRRYPEGFCGICERCGEPGHTRHYPGPVPYTGALCDRCYRVMARTWPFRTLNGWLLLLFLGGALAILYAIVRRVLG